MTTPLIKLSPSMMCADYLNLREELDVLKSEKVDMLHIDIMDGNYVPNFTLGPDLAYIMNGHTNIPLDFHLMIENVDSNYGLFTKVKGSTVTFHPETSKHPVRTLSAIQSMGCKAGLAIDPGMSIETVKHLLPLADMICVMTVNPGFAGQKLLPFCIDKIKELSDLRNSNDCDFEIEVDGNVSWENIPIMLNAGADILVLGTSSVFTKDEPRKESYGKLKKNLADSKQ